MTQPTPAPTIAYLAEGKLYLRDETGKVAVLQSPYAKGLIEQAERSAEKNAWRYNSADMGMQLWNFRGNSVRERVISFCAITRAEPGKLLYSIDTGSTSGLFLYETQTGEERRLVHRRQVRAQGLNRHPTDGTIACSTGLQNGAEHLALMNPDGSRLREITDGDVLDQAPSWVPTEKETLLYQSAGLSRSAQGFVLAVGPYAILKLDLITGNLDPVLESPHTDYLLPKQDSEGNLYFISRPYISGYAQSPSPMQTIKNILFFPFWLIWAIYHMLYGLIHFVAMMKNQEPPKWAGGPANTPTTPNRALMLYGRLVQAQPQDMKSKSEPTGLVPDDWQLIKRDPAGKEQIIAKAVLSYDLSEDGVVYTNGRKVQFLDKSGNTQTLAQGELIEHVSVTG